MTRVGVPVVPVVTADFFLEEVFLQHFVGPFTTGTSCVRSSPGPSPARSRRCFTGRGSCPTGPS